MIARKDERLSWQSLAEDHEISTTRGLSFYRNTFENNHAKYRYHDTVCPRRASVSPFGLIDDLTDCPTFEAEFFSFHSTVRAASDELMAEGRELLKRPMELYSHAFEYSKKHPSLEAELAAFVKGRTMFESSIALLKKHRWWPLYFLGNWSPHSYLQQTPIAWQIAQEVVRTSHYVFEVSFLRLEPGGRLAPHVDLHNGLINYFVVIDCEENAAALQVDDQVKTLEPRDSFGFDNTFRHSAWNNGSKPRMVFSALVRHPLLTLEEAREIKMLEDYLGELK